MKEKMFLFLGIILCLIFLNPISASTDIDDTLINTTGNLTIDFGTLFVNSNTNRVGIGTITPSVELHIVGDILANNFNTSSDRTYVGEFAGSGNTGSETTLIGYRAGVDNTGNELTAFGAWAGDTSSGNYNTFFGYAAGYEKIGAYNTYIGGSSGSYYAGNYNIGMGYSSCYQTTANYTIGIGWEALRANFGNDVVAIGYEAGEGNTLDNQFILKQTRVNAIPLIQGNFSSGYVGIGLISPSGKLHVNTTGNANALVVNDLTGNIGIGTTNPSSQLTVNDTGDTLIRIDTASADAVYLEMTNDGTTNYFIAGIEDGGFLFTDSLATEAVVGTYGSDTIHLIPNDVIVMTLKSTGNVGIGTINPKNKLNVIGDGNFTGNLTILENILLKDNKRIYFNTAQTKSLYYNSSIDVPIFESPSNDVTLMLVSSQYPSLYFRDKDTPTNNVEFVFDIDDSWGFGGSYLLINPNGIAKNGTIFTDGSSAIILTVDAINDRVGIGTSTPQNKFNVIGAVNATTGFITGANTGLTGNYSVGSCYMAYSGGIMYSTNCTSF